MLRNREWKMLVLIATGLGVGAGAIAACVVPWLYCKPPDRADEVREASEIGDATNPESHYETVDEDDVSTAATSYRINGVDYVRFIVPRGQLSRILSSVSTSAMHDSTTIDTSEQASSLVEQARLIFRGSNNVRNNFRPWVNTDFTTTDTIVSESLNVTSSSVPNARGASATLQPGGETSNFTDGYCSTESTGGTSVTTITSVFSNAETIRGAHGTAAESTNVLSTGIYDSTSSEAFGPPIASVGTQIAYSTTDQRSTGTTIVGTRTFELSNNSMSGPGRRVSTSPNVVSSKMSNVLETIAEVSTVIPPAAPSVEPLPEISRQSRCNDGSSTIRETPIQRIVTNEGTTVTYSTFDRRNDATTTRTLDSPDSTQSGLTKRNYGDNDMTIDGRRRRRRDVGLSGRLKKIWRGIKNGGTLRSGDRRNDSCKLHDDCSVLGSSASTEKYFPPGHSTKIGETQDISVTNRIDGSSLVSRTCTFKLFEEAGISRIVDDRRTDELQYGTELDEKTDASNRSSAESGNGDEARRNSSIGCRVSRNETQSYRNEDAIDDRVESGCLPKSNGLPRKIKKIFGIGTKDRKSENTSLTYLRKGQLSNSRPVESQRDSTDAFAPQRTRIARTEVVTTSDSSTDASSYIELGVAPSRETYFDLPRTEL